MATLWQDLRYGIRMLSKNAGFAAVALITLALGIGANTAIFSVVNTVLLRSLPYKDPPRLVAVQGTIGAHVGSERVSPADFLDWREQNHVFEQIAAFRQRSINLMGAGEPLRLRGTACSTTFFSLLGVQPILGRTFLPNEEKAGHDPVVVLSYALWQGRFGSDPNVIGRSLTIDGQAATVLGVMPAQFQFPAETDLWMPPRRLVPEVGFNTGDETKNRGLHYLSVIARLAPGVSREQAQAEMKTIAARLEQQYPDTNTHWSVYVEPLQESLVKKTRPALLVLLGAVGCILLIACVNVANLLLARATARQREIAIRTALGAGRLRLARQLLTESVALSLAGGAAGLFVAVWGVQLLLPVLPKDIFLAQDIHFNSGVLFFTFGLSLLTGILFGLAPAMQVSKSDLHDSLKEGGRSLSGGARGNWLRSSLVSAEMAVSLVLLVGAGLLLRSFLLLERVDPGFQPQQVLTMRLAPSGQNYHTDAQRIAFFTQVLERIRALPGVRSASVIDSLPVSGSGSNFTFFIEGVPVARPERPSANFRIAGPGYFRTMGIPLLRGRDFTERDNDKTPHVVIVNEELARHHFPNQDPIGKRIGGFETDENGKDVMLQIIGVVGNVKTDALNMEVRPEAYETVLQDNFPFTSFVIRTASNPMALASTIKSAVQDVDKDQPISSIRTMDEVIASTIVQPRFEALLLGVFSLVALVLAAVGIYGVMACSVAQRTHEIGIRMALGAQTGDVLRLVVGHGTRLALAGAAIGLAAALALSRVLASFLFGISATDPLTFTAVALLLVGVALAACYVPARRATKVDPMVALRYE